MRCLRQTLFWLLWAHCSSSKSWNTSLRTKCSLRNRIRRYIRKLKVTKSSDFFFLTKTANKMLRKTCPTRTNVKKLLKASANRKAMLYRLLTDMFLLLVVLLKNPWGFESDEGFWIATSFSPFPPLEQRDP